MTTNTKSRDWYDWLPLAIWLAGMIAVVILGFVGV